MVFSPFFIVQQLIKLDKKKNGHKNKRNNTIIHDWMNFTFINRKWKQFLFFFFK